MALWYEDPDTVTKTIIVSLSTLLFLAYTTRPKRVAAADKKTYPLNQKSVAGWRL